VARHDSTSIQLFDIDAVGTPIPFVSYLEVSASLTSESTSIEVINGSGELLKIAIGPAGSEQDVMFIPAADPTLTQRGLLLSAGMRISIRAVDALANTGTVLISLWK